VSETTLSRKDDPYLLCEKQCRELCKYLNVITLNMPRYEKHILSAKMRDCGYSMLELAVCVRLKVHKKTDFTKFSVQKELLKNLLQLSYDCGHIDLKKFRTANNILTGVGKRLSPFLSASEVG